MTRVVGFGRVAPPHRRSLPGVLAGRCVGLVSWVAVMERFCLGCGLGVTDRVCEIGGGMRDGLCGGGW